MLNINVYDTIDKRDVVASMLGLPDFTFNADTLLKVLNEHPDEKEIRLNINCDGGSVNEGLRIYDVLRTSGKEIYTNVEGNCHSMAVVLLLSAPKENRTANQNARALIHEVRAGVSEMLTATELTNIANEIQQEQDAILNIYAERTGHDRTELEALMKKEKVNTAKELQKYGFIAKINQYTTNQKKQEMSEQTKKGILNVAGDFLKKVNQLLQIQPVNYDFTDADGNVVMSTEKEDDSLAVGDPVMLPEGATEGKVELADGRTIVVAEGIVAEIIEPEMGNEEVANLKAEIETLKNTLAEATNVITDLKNEIGSKETIAPRNVAPKTKVQNVQKTVEEYKNELKNRK